MVPAQISILIQHSDGRTKMRIQKVCLILFILLGFSIAAAGQTNPPPMPLRLPANVSWVRTYLATQEDGSRTYQRHAFIARGTRWRLEYDMFNRATTVFVFDGKSMTQ